MTAEKMLWEYAGDILTSPTMAREHGQQQDTRQHGGAAHHAELLPAAVIALGGDALQHPSGSKMGLGCGLAESGAGRAAP